MNTAVVMQPVITKEFVSVMAVPVTMDGTTNLIVQVILVSIDTNLSCKVLVLKQFYEEESVQIELFCFLKNSISEKLLTYRARISMLLI